MKTYFFVQFGNEKAWISTSHRDEREYISGLRADIAEASVSHLVFVCNDWKGSKRVAPIAKEQFREFAKMNGLELVGARIGWSGWQGKVSEEDTKALAAAKAKFFRAFYKKHGDSLAIAKQSPDYVKYVA